MTYDYFIASRYRNKETVLELAHKIRGECILIGEQQETESLYLIFDESYSTIDEFIHRIK